MTNVYKNATNDKNAYAEDGWDISLASVTIGDATVFKGIRIPFEDDMVQGLIKQYNSEEFQNVALKIGSVSKYYESIGYKFEEIYNDLSGKKEKRLILDEATKEKLCSWRIEMNFSDGYLRLSPYDMAFPYAFYNESLLRKYADDIVNGAIRKGLVECAKI